MAIIPGFAGLDALIQDNTLQRLYHDALWPRQLFRMEAQRERWEASQGDTLTQTRGSLLTPVSVALAAGTDPVPDTEAFEQWTITAAPYGKTIDTLMPVSRAALASKFARDAKTLGLNAGQSLNLLVRNKLFSAYLGGTTHTDNAESPGTAPIIGSLNGFTEVLDSDGQVQTVSTAFPKAITIGGTAASVTGFSAADANFPLGRGTLTLAAGITYAAADVVIAVDRANQIYSGGGTSTDALAATDILTLADIRRAVATLQADSVPPHVDGKYHAHIDPFVVSQAYSDNEFQRLNESNYSDAPYRDFIIGSLLGTYFYRDEEVPGFRNSGTLQTNRASDAGDSRLSGQISADVRNKGNVEILRTIITGGGDIYERYIPEMEYLTEAGTTGKQGGFSIETNNVQVDVDGIRFILRSPLDRLGQIVAQTWSWSGDWGIPSDLLGGRSVARFKRAVVINSGS